jgi:hypothetical protein
LPCSLEQGQINNNKERALAQNICIHEAKANNKLILPALKCRAIKGAGQ